MIHEVPSNELEHFLSAKGLGKLPTSVYQLYSPAAKIYNSPSYHLDIAALKAPDAVMCSMSAIHSRLSSNRWAHPDTFIRLRRYSDGPWYGVVNDPDLGPYTIADIDKRDRPMGDQNFLVKMSLEFSVPDGYSARYRTLLGQCVFRNTSIEFSIDKPTFRWMAERAAAILVPNSSTKGMGFLDLKVRLVISDISEGDEYINIDVPFREMRDIADRYINKMSAISATT